MHMNDEMFDEPRKCPTCKVVTYCDNCPVCGRRLPRSNRAMWKMTHKQDVAGEEGITNDLKHERIEERILESMHHGYKSSSSPIRNNEHVEPTVSFDQKNTRGARKDLSDSYTMNRQSSNNNVFKVIAVCIVIVVFLGIIGFVSNKNVDTLLNNFSDNVPTSNSSEIISDYVDYDRSVEKSTVSLSNIGERAYYGDVLFYNDKGIQIGEFTDLSILPHEVFDLRVYADEEVASFEIDESCLFDLQTQAPNFEYTAFNDYGSLSIYLQKDIGRSDLEILVKHMYEASTVNALEVIYDMQVLVNDEYYYDCFIDEFSGVVTVYPEEEAVFIQDSFEFNLTGNNENKGVADEVSL